MFAWPSCARWYKNQAGLSAWHPSKKNLLVIRSSVLTILCQSRKKQLCLTITFTVHVCCPSPSFFLQAAWARAGESRQCGNLSQCAAQQGGSDHSEGSCFLALSTPSLAFLRWRLTHISNIRLSISSWSVTFRLLNYLTSEYLFRHHPLIPFSLPSFSVYCLPVLISCF